MDNAAQIEIAYSLCTKKLHKYYREGIEINCVIDTWKLKKKTWLDIKPEGCTGGRETLSITY